VIPAWERERRGVWGDVRNILSRAQKGLGSVQNDLPSPSDRRRSGLQRAGGERSPLLGRQPAAHSAGFGAAPRRMGKWNKGGETAGVPLA